MYLKIKFILTVSFLGIFCSYGQNFEDELLSIAKAVRNSSSIKIESKIKVYDKKEGELTYDFASLLHKSGSLVRSKIESIETLKTKEYDVQINHENKTVFITSKEEQQKMKKDALDLMNLEQLADQFKKKDSEGNSDYEKPVITLISNVNGKKVYKVSINNLESEFKLDTKNNRMLFMKQVTEDGVYVEIVYTQFELSEVSSKPFSLSDYFIKKEDKFILMNNLKTYQLLN